MAGEETKTDEETTPRVFAGHVTAEQVGIYASPEENSPAPEPEPEQSPVVQTGHDEAAPKSTIPPVPAAGVDDDFMIERPDEVQQEQVKKPEVKDTDPLPGFSVPEYPENTIQTHEIYKKRMTRKELEESSPIVFPSHHNGVVVDAVAKTNEEFLSTKEGALWKDVALSGRRTHQRHAGSRIDPETGHPITPSAFERTVSREGAEWVQYIESPKGPLCALKPGIEDNGPVILTGMQAVNRIRSYMGIGDVIKVPLYHSGFWITLRAPLESDLVNFYRQVSASKVDLGRMTAGATLSNLNAVIVQHLATFIGNHVQETTYYDLNSVMSRVLAPDFDHLVWALACTIYVNGFDYARAVMGKTEAECVTIGERINLSKIQWADRRALTDEQIRHMTNRAPSSMTAASVDRYQEIMRTRGNRQAAVKSQYGVEMKLDFKIPTLTEYINTGSKWVDAIINMVDMSLGSDASESERNNEINKQGAAAYLRMYLHWIEAINVGNTTVNDEDAMGMIIGDVSHMKGNVRQQVVEAITKYIDDILVSIIALPALTDDEAKTLPRHPHLIPLNVIQTFFTLLVQRNLSLPMDDLV